MKYIYVDLENGCDTWLGTEKAPFRTTEKAFASIDPNKDREVRIIFVDIQEE